MKEKPKLKVKKNNFLTRKTKEKIIKLLIEKRVIKNVKK